MCRRRHGPTRRDIVAHDAEKEISPRVTGRRALPPHTAVNPSTVTALHMQQRVHVQYRRCIGRVKPVARQWWPVPVDAS